MKIFTIGYGGWRTPSALADFLIQHGVKVVVDVRLRPDRSAIPGFSKASNSDKGIENSFITKGLRYFSFVELGICFRAKISRIGKSSTAICLMRLGNFSPGGWRGYLSHSVCCVVNKNRKIAIV